VKSRIRATALLLLIVGAALVTLHCIRTSEPSYHGRLLSAWVNQYGGNYRPPVGTDPAATAIRAIGTNGLPYLTAWAVDEPTLFGRHHLSWAPKPIIDMVDHLARRRVYRAEASRHAIEMLGTNAAAAIPELARLMMNTRDQAIRFRTALTINHLGPQALPAMLLMLSNAPATEKPLLSSIIGSGLPQNVYSRDQVPLLFPILQMPDDYLRSAASNAVWRVAPDLLTSAPAH
jgi:hypothetical protein